MRLTATRSWVKLKAGTNIHEIRNFFFWNGEFQQTPPSINGTTLMRYSQWILESIIQFHDGSLITAPVAVIWCTENRHYVAIVTPVVTLQKVEGKKFETFSPQSCCLSNVQENVFSQKYWEIFFGKWVATFYQCHLRQTIVISCPCIIPRTIDRDTCGDDVFVTHRSWSLNTHLHDQLMGSRYKCQSVAVVEGLRDVLAKGVSSSSGRDSPASSVVRVWPQQVTHWTLKEFPILNSFQTMTPQGKKKRRISWGLTYLVWYFLNAV